MENFINANKFNTVDNTVLSSKYPLNQSLVAIQL